MARSLRRPTIQAVRFGESQSTVSCLQGKLVSDNEDPTTGAVAETTGRINMRKILLASVAAFAFTVMAVPADAAREEVQWICHFQGHGGDEVIGTRATGQDRKDCKESGGKSKGMIAKQ